MTDFVDNIPPALKPVASSPTDPATRASASIRKYSETPPPLLKIEDSAKLVSSRSVWKPLAIDVGQFEGDLLTLKSNFDQINHVNGTILQDQPKYEESVHDTSLASDHMHYAKTSRLTNSRPKIADSKTPFLIKKVARLEDREEMDSGLDSPNDPDAYEKTDSPLNVDQQNHTTTNSLTPDNFYTENAGNIPNLAMVKKKPRKRRWILSRKPKVHRSSAKIAKIDKVEKTVNVDQSRYNQNGFKNLEPLVHSSVFSPPNNNNRNFDVISASSFEDRNVIFSENFLELLCKFLPNLNRIVENIPKTSDHSIKNWSIDQAADFIRNLKLSSATTAEKPTSSCKGTTTKQRFQWLQPTADDHLAEKFRDEQIDGEALLLLSKEDLVRRLNIKLGLATKIYYTIKCLNYKVCSMRNGE